jgi:hypothetical protein
VTLRVPAFILIYALGDHLLITPERYHEWRQHADDRGILVWNRQGEVRTIDADVLDNALNIYVQYATLESNEIIEQMPEVANRILWSQARPVPPKFPPVRV